jgi:hypothetical protein
MDFIFGDNQTTHKTKRRARIEEAIMQNVDETFQVNLGKA